MQLTNEHIRYIENDLAFRGIVDERLGEELLDHICTLVEEKMAGGYRFIEAYEMVRKQFGNTNELQQLQTQTIQDSNYNTKIMIRNYFKMAVRNLKKHKFYSLINIIGLAVSISCCIVISLFVINELQIDTTYEDSDQIYRTVRHSKYGDNEAHFPTAPAPFGPALANEIPEIESVTRFRNSGSFLVRTKDMTESIKEGAVRFTDSTFFDVFGIELINGDRSTILKNPQGIALSEKAAAKYFMSNDIIGKSIFLDDQEYFIEGVFEDLPQNSHLSLDFAFSNEALESSKNNMWLSNNFFTYFKVREGTNRAELEDKINRMADAYVYPQIEQFAGATKEQFLEGGNYFYFELQALPEVYLYSSFTFDIGPTGDITFVYLFTIIALFILVIACINFMNLSTARSANRAKEVGVRKVLGSYKSHLIRQFLVESILLSVIAFAISLLIVNVVLPFFNQLANKTLALPTDEPLFYAILGGGSLFVGLLAGIYPAFFLSSFKPVTVLKGKLSGGSKSGFVRSILVVFQFFISIVLIIGTITVYRQLNFIQNKNVGFNKDQVVLINDVYMLDNNLNAFKEEVENLSFVSSSTLSGFLPINGYNRSDNAFWNEGEEPTNDNMVNMQYWAVDDDYIETMGLSLIQGRNLNRELASDSNAVVLNQTAFESFGLDPNEDNWIQTFAYDYNSGTIIQDEFTKLRVVGVIEDFHFESMKQPIGNLALYLGRSRGTLSVRANSANFGETISAIEGIWKKMTPTIPFNYNFLNEAFGRMYENENRLASVFTVFAGLAVFIGCLGLFALSAFMAEQRTKEIGIRKVMGASVKNVVVLMSSEFSKLVIISFILAAPVSWWGVNAWLSQYEYHVNVGFEVYLLAGLLAFLVALFTISYQSINAALSNPIDSLRND